MAIDSTQLPSNSMPNETPQIGDGSAAASNRKALESAGSSRQGGAPPSNIPPQGAPPAPSQGQPPVQPPPRQPLNQNDMRPGGPVFMQPQMAPAPSWRQQLRTWAQHPEARVIRQLSQRADAGMKTKPPQQ